MADIPVKRISEMMEETRIKAGKGISCPKCGCVDLRVFKTSHRIGETDRRRECRNCGHRITTMEVTVG